MIWTFSFSANQPHLYLPRAQAWGHAGETTSSSRCRVSAFIPGRPALVRRWPTFGAAGRAQAHAPPVVVRGRCGRVGCSVTAWGGLAGFPVSCRHPWQGGNGKVRVRKTLFFYLPGLSRAPMRLTVTMAGSAGERPPVLQTWLVAVVGACSTAARACSLVLASGVVYLLWKASLFFWDGACAVFSCCRFTCKPCVYAGI